MAGNGNERKPNNCQIDATSYYQLPCGKFLEDFIYYKNLNFNMGSAVKYKWRAGHKDGETAEKDLKKADHYINFEAKCRGYYTLDGKPLKKWIDLVASEVESLIAEAKVWKG